jgi:hypothetical protein
MRQIFYGSAAPSQRAKRERERENEEKCPGRFAALPLFAQSKSKAETGRGGKKEPFVH